jgi:hypothetical protein
LEAFSRSVLNQRVGHEFSFLDPKYVREYVLTVLNSWEFHVTESDKDLWRIQSLIPPSVGSEAMKSWVEAGKGVPWEGMEKP